MKKYFGLLVFTVLSGQIFAQEFYGGVLAGFNGSQVEGDLSSGYNKLGLIGGAWVQRDIKRNFYWGMELKLNQKGSRLLPTQKNNYNKYTFRLNYIELPVLMGYKYKQFSFFTGLSFGYLFNKRMLDSYGQDVSVFYDYISDWELGMFAGIRADFERLVNRRWAKNFILETRFQYSALSIDNAHDLFSDFGSVGQFNNLISTVLYYRIDWPAEN